MALVVVTNSSVYPSGGELIAVCAATLVPPPGLFSTTTDWPRRSVSHAPMMRATRSVETAGGKAEDQAHRPRGVALRARGHRGGRKRGGSRSETQKFAAGKLHGRLPRHVGWAQTRAVVRHAFAVRLHFRRVGTARHHSCGSERKPALVRGGSTSMCSIACRCARPRESGNHDYA